MPKKATKLQVGDRVIVRTGVSRGQIGEILSLKNTEKRGIYVTVSGINLRQKAVKPNPQTGEEGGFKSVNGAIHTSNIAIYNSETGKSDKIGLKIEKDKKTRIYRGSGKPVVAPKAK